jgi:hypothetical protein
MPLYSAGGVSARGTSVYATGTTVLIPEEGISVPLQSSRAKAAIWVNIANNSLGGKSGTVAYVLANGAGTPNPVPVSASRSYLMPSGTSWVLITGEGANVTYVISTDQQAVSYTTVSGIYTSIISATVDVTQLPFALYEAPPSGAIAIRAAVSAFSFNSATELMTRPGSGGGFPPISWGSIDSATWSFGPEPGATVVSTRGLVLGEGDTILLGTGPTTGSITIWLELEEGAL